MQEINHKGLKLKKVRFKKINPKNNRNKKINIRGIKTKLIISFSILILLTSLSIGFLSSKVQVMS